MSYKISFKGDRTPEIVSDERGELMYQDWQNDTMPIKVEIRKGLTIEKSSIKSIELIVDHHAKPQFTPQVLRNFEETKLARYLEEDGSLTYQKKLAFLVASDLLDIVTHNTPIRTLSDATLYVRQARVAEYTLMVEMLDAWYEWKGRKAYAMRKSAETAGV